MPSGTYWYEILHALQPGSTALAATDSDGDGLNNAQEYQRRTNPRLADTDGDGRWMVWNRPRTR